MTPEAMKMRNAIAAVLAEQLNATPTPARRAADAVMDALPQFFGESPATRLENPERCGQRHVQPSTNTEYRCSLAVDHHGGCHMDMENNATWTGAGDLAVKGVPVIPVPADGTCGASLVFSPTGRAYSCALQMGHDVTSHHDVKNNARWSAAPRPATAGTVMDAQTARHYAELVRLAAPGEEGALNLGPIIERHREAAGVPGLHHPDVLPLVREVMKLRREARDAKPTMPGDAVLRSALPGIARHIEDMRHVFAELLAATCTGCREVAVSSNPEDGADLETMPGCPVHGDVAELRRSLAWAASQHERIVLALGPEYTAPFGADAAQAAVNCIKTARGIDAVLREAGIEHPLGLRGVEDLANQRDGALEQVTEIRDAVRAEIIATVHQGHSADLDDCTHHQCVDLRGAAAA